MRGDRLVSLLLLLQSRGRTTAQVLAEELGVSLRTIYRDLAALEMAGIPVCASGGPGGGCWLMEGYRSGLTGLTVREADALVRLGLPGPLRDLGLSGVMNSIRRKVTAAQRDAAEDSTRFLIDTPAWFRPAEVTPALPVLVEAVQRGRRLQISHRKETASARRRSEVGALGLVCKGGLWYLVAHSDRGPAVYRASRIEAAEVLAADASRPPGFDLVAFWEAWSRDFEATRPRTEVTVRARPEMISVLPEVFGEGARAALREAEPQGDGSAVLKLSFESAEAAAYRLVGFGAGLEVVEPEAVRERIVRAASAALDLYRQADP
ncbi:MAG: WYL domain-containing protein [Candidatus Dormibacteraeota bacterium]|nr:WYL domain-containing protein [Candidatus Dormibacteraeota bacterium]